MKRAILDRWLAPLQRRVEALLARAVVRGVTEDGRRRRLKLGVLKGELLDGVDHWEPLGITARPRDTGEVEAILASLGGWRDRAAAIVVSDRAARPTDLAPGELALYTHLGEFLRFKADGTLVLKPPGSVVEVEGTLQVSGDVVAQGNVQDGTCSMLQMRTDFGTHVHPGVTSGGSSTGAPAVGMCP